MSEEIGVLDPQGESQPTPAVVQDPTPSAVDVARKEAEAAVVAERPKYLGEYDSEEAAKAEFQKLKQEREEYNRKLEEYNRSDRVRAAREQDAKEQQEREEYEHQRLQHSQAVRDKAAQWIAAGRPDKAFEVMDQYNIQNAAVVAKAMYEKEMEQFKPYLEQVKYKAKFDEAKAQFEDHPDLQDIKEYSGKAAGYLLKGIPARDIVEHFREVKQMKGGGRSTSQMPEQPDNVVEFEDQRERAHREARSLAPGGGGSAPRKAAAVQEREAKERGEFFMDVYGPLAPKVQGK